MINMKSHQDSLPFQIYEKKFIIKVPSTTHRSYMTCKTKRNNPLSMTAQDNSVKKILNLSSSRVSRMLNLNQTTLKNDYTDNSLNFTNKFFSPRPYSLNKIKKYRFRKQTISNQNDNQFQENFENHSEYCKIKILAHKNSQYDKQNRQSQDIVQYKIKVSSTTNLIEILKNKLKNKNCIGFHTQPKNILLDLFLTFDHCDASYLNGTTLNLSVLQRKTYSKIDISAFQILKCIGSGGFSKVFLCRFKQDGKFYALKLIDKKFILKHKKTKIVMNERNIMQSVDHPFVVKMKFAFQTSNNLAFVLEYCPGSQMFSIIKKYKKFTEQMARFYMIQILLGLEYLHKEGVIYRDFKPQNILLDLKGHIKIADFGLAKPNYYSSKDRAYSFCGSPQYMPPQMILKEGHSLAVDFYCLGAVLYQFVTGLPPFYSKDTNQIYQSTVNEQITFPSKCKLSSQLKNLLKGLLCKQQSKRLGSLCGARQVLAHPWFGKFSREEYLKKQVRPPTNFTTINSLIIQSEQHHKNEYYIMEAKRQQQPDKKAFQTILGAFYYDYRFEAYQIKEQESNVKINSQLNFKKKNQCQNIFRLNSQRTSCNLLKRLSNAKLTLHRLNTKQTEHQNEKSSKIILT